MTNTTTSWIAAARWIVANSTARLVNFETGELVAGDVVDEFEEETEDTEQLRGLRSPAQGTVLDLFSAGAMVQIHDALGETNRAKLAAMPLFLAHDVVFKIINKQRTV